MAEPNTKLLHLDAASNKHIASVKAIANGLAGRQNGTPSTTAITSFGLIAN